MICSFQISHKDFLFELNFLNLLVRILRTCPKTLKNLHDSYLEIFNKTQ
ncbi:hypothetical protein LEP1GSC075_3663 [Leptospira interrogans str. Kito]|nr:hypothetical protein LEP1GSC069_2586 [Leptospira interrogans serovar Canicola str. Fiocruz LV133]EMK19337.1 hypothetical protein LEP1GSC075_3663 [Leptospira interrogans str. Kito]EMN76045.1 hypothetical protein LEP1GSC102_3090 [Leptospira interrogans str. UI 09600]